MIWISLATSQREITQMLQVSNVTVNKDLTILRQPAKDIHRCHSN
ncbi:MAG: DeoR family transcriptional regulator [Nitrososphaeraceae archaeon]